MIPPLIPRLTVEQAAVAARRHPKTILKALADGDLHGVQRMKGGRWIVRQDCLDSWMDGAPCAHQPSNVTKLRKTG